jgi:hypothetical protein
MEDRNRDITLNQVDSMNNNELSFSKPSCEPITGSLSHLLCTSIVTVSNPRLTYKNNQGDGHLVTTPLILTINSKTMTFTKPLRIKFENIVRNLLMD